MPNPTKRRRSATLALILLAGTALSGTAIYEARAETPTQAAQSGTPIAVPPAQLPSFADLVEHVRPAVVTITSTEHVQQQDQDSPFPPGSPPDQMFRRYFGMQNQEHSSTVQALGSGFIIDAEGHIVTNNHVIQGATHVTVKLEDGRTVTAKVVGHDKRTDLALLKINVPEKLPYLALGDSDKARPGDWVVAIGNPFGLGGTVTAGVVSARGRDIGDGPYDDFLQIDAPINRGNSGGPLFSLNGQVIGVNTAILSPSGGSIGIGFAIPSNIVKHVVDQLAAHGHIDRGWLGVATQPVDKGMAAALGLKGTGGALVAQADPKSPAALAGVQAGDVITTVNGTNVKSPRDLARMIADLAPHSDATLGLRRDGADKTIKLSLGEMPNGDSDSADASSTTQGHESIGVGLQELTPDARNSLGLDDSVKGALVGEVKPNSPAQEAGLQPGDVIVGVGSEATPTPDRAVQAIRNSLKNNHGAVALRIMRNGQSAFVAVQTGAKSDDDNG